MKNIIMDNNILVTTNGTKVTVTLKGGLTLPNIANIKAEVEKALKGARSLLIETADVDDVDLSFFQLIMSIRSFCKVHSINLETKIELPKESQQLLTKAGLNF